ncbi:hypothetical protein MNAN1_000954 [Malassezia nana]|uniref:Uncharacterized protein n=1 Tax=Malassezia nana TaxID=180528 RepID=A0AAF0ENH3_9BASI|nr:hypothetical protein MNAN1_000954 [Malassezia nana]
MREGLERRKQQGLPIDENVEKEVNAQLASATKPSETVQRSESKFPRTMTVDDIEDVQISGEDDWDGEDTAEARRQRERAHLSSVEEQDIVDTHHQDDFDLEGQHFEKDHDEEDSKYPLIEEWIEGHNIVVNITEKELDEPETIVIPIHPDDYEAVKESQSPLRSFIYKYEDKLTDRLAWNEKRKLSDLTMREIQQKNLMKKVANTALSFEKRLHKGHKRTEDDRESVYPELEVVNVHPNGKIVDV